MTKAFLSLNMKRVFGSLPPFTFHLGPIVQPQVCRSVTMTISSTCDVKSPTKIQTACFRAGMQKNTSDLRMCGRLVCVLGLFFK